jgi:copper homeostasis protein
MCRKTRATDVAASTPTRIVIEVIVQTLEDARAAWQGGADRLEVVRDIMSGGLTPEASLVDAIAAETGLPLRVMVRENAGYATDAAELPRLCRAVERFSQAGVDGIVLGFAAQGRVAMRELRAALESVPEASVTFHRAFDQLDDPLAAIDEIAQLRQVDRILTNGGGGDAPSRAARLRQYVDRAGDRLRILAGGGVDAGAFELFARTRCVDEIHVGRLARDADAGDAPVSAARVRRLREVAG